MSKIDIEAEFRALGERIRKETEEWCDSPEGRAQSERLMARIFGADEARGDTDMTTQTTTTQPLALPIPGWGHGEEQTLAAIRIMAGQHGGIQFSEIRHELVAGAQGRSVLTLRVDGVDREIWGPVGPHFRHWDLAVAMVHARELLEAAGLKEVLDTPEAIQLAAAAHLDTDVSMLCEQTRGDGAAYTWAATVGGIRRSVTMYRGHLLAPDAWIVPSGRSYDDVDDPVSQVVRALGGSLPPITADDNLASK